MIEGTSDEFHSSPTGDTAAKHPAAAGVRSEQAKITAVVCVGAFMGGLDLFIVNLAFPSIQRNFGGTSLSELSWVLTTYAIIYAAILAPGGRFADRAGRKRTFLAGLALFTVASGVCAAAPSVAILIAGRALQAAGAALIIPTSLALLLPEYPPQRRQFAVGIWATFSAGAAALGPPLGGVLTEVSWRLIFLVNIPIGLFTFIAGWRLLRETRDTRGPSPDALGGALVAVSVGALALVIAEGQEWGWSSPGIVTAAVICAASAALLAYRSVAHPAPMIEAALLRVRAFAAASVAALLFFTAFASYLLVTVPFLTGAWHESPLVAGLMLAPAPAAAAVMSVPASALSQRIGQARTGAIGALLVGLANAWLLTTSGAAPRYAVELLPGLLVGGIGTGLIIPSLQGAAAATLPPARLATGTGIVTTARQIGMVLGVAVLVAILGRDRDTRPPPTIVLGAYAVAVLTACTRD
jgi:EmrB/QacA subfamily drug resistance transporter